MNTAARKRPPRAAALLAAATLLALPAGPAGGAELDVEAVLAPVIALTAKIPESARSAASLGTSRVGTGVVIDGAGLVLTVGYLILEAHTVGLAPDGPGGRRVAADVVAYDHVTGFGLVRAREPLGIRPMPLGESATLARGDPVIVAAYGGSDNLQPAVVVDRRAYAGYWEYLLEDALYVAPIHPMFGGAALVGLDGRLLGIGALAVPDADGGEDSPGNVFVPVDVLKPVLAELLLDGRSAASARPWLGLYCEEVGESVVVRGVAEDGPAERAGVAGGDVIVAVAGEPIGSLAGFYRHLWSVARAGERVAIEIRRDGVSRHLDVEASDRYRYLGLAR